MTVTYNKYEISVLNKMWIKGAFGNGYESVNHFLSDIPPDQRDKGKDAIKSLQQKGIVGTKPGEKDGEVAAIFSDRVEEVRDILDGEVPDYVLDLH